MADKDVGEKVYGVLAVGDIRHFSVCWMTRWSGRRRLASPWPAPTTARKPSLRMFARLGSEWDGFKAEADEIVAEVNEVVALGAYSGTYKATGKSFSARFAHVFTERSPPGALAERNGSDR
jgi:uncharacterized protein